MITKEEIVQTVDGVSQSELEQLAQFLAFIKYQSRITTIPSFDESQLAALYAAPKKTATSQKKECQTTGWSFGQNMIWRACNSGN